MNSAGLAWPVCNGRKEGKFAFYGVSAYSGVFTNSREGKEISKMNEWMILIW